MNLNPLHDKNASQNIEIYVKTALVFLTIYACFMIFKPFLLPVVWGIIIAIALFPLHKKLTRVLNNKAGLSATLITLVLLTIIILPSISLTGSLVSNVRELSEGIKEGTLEVPPPNESVAEWPLIGKRSYEAWSAFSDNLTAAFQKYDEQLKNLGQKFVSTLSGFAGTVLVFVVAIIIAGVFLSNSNKGYSWVNTIFRALVGEKYGDEFMENSRATISSVVKGVLGTAIIQTAIIAIALFVFDVPAAAILTIIVLFFAIAQLPPSLIMIPVVIYMFSQLPTVQAVIFAIWAIVGSISDSFIKPLLLGRGVQIPMLVILIGAIGGMVVMGIIGLFIGAVIMALGYQLLQLWLKQEKMEQEEAGVEEA